jgi:hypothetical protein
MGMAATEDLPGVKLPLAEDAGVTRCHPLEPPRAADLGVDSSTCYGLSNNLLRTCTIHNPIRYAGELWITREH